MPRIVWMFVLALLAGCGGSREVENNVEAASQAYDEGVAAFESRNYQLALEKLTIATDSGWLSTYTYPEAMIKRAVANAALGNFEAANADLQNAGYEADKSMVLAARAFILKKQGKTAQAQQAFQQAKRLNRGVKPFE